MEFEIEKCDMLIIMRSGKWHMTGGIELPNQDNIRIAQRKGNLQIIGNIGRGHHQISGNERKSILGEQENYSNQTI